MKRLIIPLLVLLIVPLFASPVMAQDAETDRPPSHVSITVVMPDPTPEDTVPPSLPHIPELDPSPEPDPAPVISTLYPTGVYNTEEGGIRWIVRTYELGADEDPADIPRGNFTRDGWRYSITDILKKETASADVRDHSEIITVNTETKDMEAILRLLAPSMEFTSEDGYTGILTLDISSINVETAGTRTSNYTASATREYPHLSSNDTSLLPKTVTDGGRTLTLTSVDWKTQTGVTVDYDELPASYTAVATYTAQASRTVATGYITTAEYKGSVSRLSQGVTIYTAYFIGEEIVPEKAPLDIIEPTSAPDCSETETDDADEQLVTEYSEMSESAEAEAETESNSFPIIIPALLFALLIGVGGGYYIPCILRNKKEKGEDSE